MIVKYGGFQFDDHEAMVTFFGPARIYNPRGRAQFVRYRMVIEGEVIKATTALIDARVQQIKEGFALEGGAAVQCTSAGAETQLKLSSNAISGVRIVAGPVFPLEEGKAHYTTGQPFHVVLEADYLASDADPLVSYTESITRIGNGGVRRVTVELDTGPPIEQIVSTNTPVTIIQSGEAVGSVAYPTSYVPQAIYPTQLENAEEAVTTITPRMNGLGFTDFPIRWQYRMTLTSNPGNPIPVAR